MHSIKTERDRRKSRESRGLKELWMVLKADLPQLLVVCAAFFTLSLLSYFYASNVMKKQVDLYSRSEMQVHHSAIRALLNAHEAALEHASVAVIYAVEKGAGPEEIHELLKTLAEMFSNQKDMKGVFGSVYGFIKGNYLDGTSWIPGEFFYPKTAPWLRGAVLTEGLYHSTPYLDPRTGNAVAAVSKVVYDKNGESVGVLGIDYFLTPIIRQVSEYRVADAGYGILLDDSYNILTCPDPEYVGKHLNEFPGFEEIYRELAKDNPKIRRAQEQADGRPAPQRILVADNKVKGVENIVFFSPLENGWYVGIIVPYPYYYSEVYRMIPVIVLISTFLALVVCVILLRMSKAKKRSEEESLAKTSFLARMSHEIRTPMNAILGMCELARRNIGRPEALEYLSEIRHAGSNLVSIINDILDYSKINTGVIQLKLNPYAAADLFYDTLAIVRVRLGSKEIDLTFEIDPNMPRKLTGDEVRVRQVILNILTNAVKYTPRGFIKFNLDCERKDQNSVWITVRVEDSGVGIKKDDLDSLFDDYVRVDQGGIRHIEGTGLGLAITKSLCLAMNGDIMVESEYGKGSTFTATLEQTVADWTPVGPITSTDRRAATFGDDSEEEELPFTAPGFKVLVVDDIHTNLVVTKGLLQPHEMNVSICDRGHKAVDLAAREQFDLIFVDHMMPEMDGTETMRKIRDINPHYREIPIIALTAAVMAGMREMFLSKGFDDFLGKPIELHKLNAILERWIPKNVRRRAKKPLMRLAKNVSDKESVPGIRVDGVDVAKGLANIGGDPETYLKVLAIFVKDVNERIPVFKKEANMENIRDFQLQVHAIKSAAANIGAAELSGEAKRLEEAAMNDDLDAINGDGPGFLSLLTEIRDNIQASLGKDPTETDAAAAGPAGKVNIEREILVTLKEAIDSRDIGTIDKILYGLSTRENDDETKETIDRISNHVLLADYDEAGLLVRIHLSRESRVI